MSINIKQWNPVNWFKHEEKEDTQHLPSKSRNFFPAMSDDPLLGVHQEIDRMFDGIFSGMGIGRLPSFLGNKTPANNFSKTLLKPSVDIKERKKDYKITVEVPGVEESDIKLELNDGALIISGEKKYEKEEKDEHYHSIERSYGSFRRVLSLPDDADENNIDAKLLGKWQGLVDSLRTDPAMRLIVIKNFPVWKVPSESSFRNRGATFH